MILVRSASGNKNLLHLFPRHARSEIPELFSKRGVPGTQKIRLIGQIVDRISIEVIVYKQIRRIIKGIQIVHINQSGLRPEGVHVLRCDEITVQNNAGGPLCLQQRQKHRKLFFHAVICGAQHGTFIPSLLDQRPHIGFRRYKGGGNAPLPKCVRQRKTAHDMSGANLGIAVRSKINHRFSLKPFQIPPDLLKIAPAQITVFSNRMPQTLSNQRLRLKWRNSVRMNGPQGK